MSENYKRVIDKYTPRMQTELQIDTILTSLRESAGGFLTEREYQEVDGQQTNPRKVEKMLQYLKGKGVIAFNRFCEILQENRSAIAQTLREEADSDTTNSNADVMRQWN